MIDNEMDKINRLIKQLPKELKDKISVKNIGNEINIIKIFCAEFDEKDKIDEIIAMQCGQLILKLHNGISEKIKEKEAQGHDFIHGKEIANIVTDAFREMYECVKSISDDL